MKKNLLASRASGVLAHLSSLPSPYGIGDLGSSSFDFIHFLADANQSFWQILPLGPTDHIFDNSPYMTVSAFAGNPLFISLKGLFQSGLLSHNDLQPFPDHDPYSVDFRKITQQKTHLLQRAYNIFQKKKDEHFLEFVEQTSWLHDYAVFMALKNRFPKSAWFQWAKDISSRHPTTIQRIEKELHESIHYYKFEQYIFFTQWQKLHNHAEKHGVAIFGDIPIYVSLDSVDVWANQDIFQLDGTTLRPTHVAGVPPDYFSKTGQKWGNPLYRWHCSDKTITDKLSSWWIRRFQSVFQLVDMARIDHFRGFESYWSIPADQNTAINGKWRKGPGKDFFKIVTEKLGPLQIVAEDLGEITKEVITLRNDLRFPGMKILQFAFDDSSANAFLPYNYDSTNYIVYTGTHDNDTTVGWFLDDKLDDTLRQKIKNFANRESNDIRGIHYDLMYLALSSNAILSIFPLQDILGFGSDCRMNIPGTAKGNWTWRCGPEFLTQETASWLKEKTILFGRSRSQV